MMVFQANHGSSRGRRAVGAIAGLSILLTVLVPTAARSQTLSDKILAMERDQEQEFETYFGQDLADVTQSPEDIAKTLERLAQETGKRPAVIWAIPRGDHLHLVAIAPGREPFVRDLYDVPDGRLRSVLQALQWELHRAPGAAAAAAGSGELRAAAQQLYQWIVEPLEKGYLDGAAIDTLLFCLGNGLRGLPLAALHDGQRFLVEKYQLTRIPAFNLIQTDYEPLRPGHFLAAGVSEFDTLRPLPGVQVELEAIALALRSKQSRSQQWSVRSLLNRAVTLTNVRRSLQASPSVVHLATHADFRPGNPSASYIQLWDESLGLDEFDRLPWNHRNPLELLVLSACKTALGDDRAELGLAGVALRSGVKSVVASLWDVSDVGTLALMAEFYQQLGHTATKAEALRQAQLGLLTGRVRIEGDRLILSRGTVALPPTLVDGAADFSAPYFWSSFTMISSPW
jgi:CHAT domain-containing protein